MIRNKRNTFAIALLIGATMACATSPGNKTEASQTRPAPTFEGLSTWLVGEAQDANGQSNYFIQMADTQLGMSEYSLPFLLLGATWNDDQFETDARLFAAAIRHANELKPAFVIICGDLVNRVGHAGQIAEFKRIAATLDSSIPLHVVAGNHDVENEPTETTLRDYRKTFGPDRYAFKEGGVYGIVLNSQIIDAPENVPEEAERQLTWTRSELARARKAGANHIIVFLHQSFFLESPDEEDEYFNISRGERRPYLDLFKEAGVEAVMAGHFHRNAYGVDGTLEMITTGPVGRPMGDDPSGFRIVEVGEDAIRHEYFSLHSLPEE